MVSPRNRLILTVLLVLGTSGCESLDPQAYWNGRGVAPVVTAYTLYEGDDSGSSDEEEGGKVRPPSECDNCSGEGWLGDGKPRSDCKLCDANGDGNNVESLDFHLARHAIRMMQERLKSLEAKSEKLEESQQEIRQQTEAIKNQPDTTPPPTTELPPSIQEGKHAQDSWTDTTILALRQRKKVILYLTNALTTDQLKAKHEKLTGLQGFNERYVACYLNPNQDWNDEQTVREAFDGIDGKQDGKLGKGTGETMWVVDLKEKTHKQIAIPRELK